MVEKECFNIANRQTEVCVQKNCNLFKHPSNKEWKLLGRSWNDFIPELRKKEYLLDQRPVTQFLPSKENSCQFHCLHSNKWPRSALNRKHNAERFYRGQANIPHHAECLSNYLLIIAFMIYSSSLSYPPGVVLRTNVDVRSDWRWEYMSGSDHQVIKSDCRSSVMRWKC